jgi:hypothetical protein
MPKPKDKTAPKVVFAMDHQVTYIKGSFRIPPFC